MKYCPRPTRKQILVGYRAANSITVETTKNLDKVGQLIDFAFGACANRVDSLYFSVSEQKQDEIRNNLIAKATEDIYHKASITIAPLDMKVSNVSNINLDSYPIYSKRRC